jgi:hypothetical protein
LNLRPKGRINEKSSEDLRQKLTVIMTSQIVDGLAID